MTNTQTTNLFEVAVRGAYRFQYRGVLTVEDLLKLNVQSLDELYQNLNGQLKELSTDSLLETNSGKNQVLENKINIVKLIVGEKLAEIERRKKAREVKESNDYIKSLIAEKEKEDLKGKTKEELQALIVE